MTVPGKYNRPNPLGQALAVWLTATAIALALGAVALNALRAHDHFSRINALEQRVDMLERRLAAE